MSSLDHRPAAQGPPAAFRQQKARARRIPSSAFRTESHQTPAADDAPHRLSQEQAPLSNRDRAPSRSPGGTDDRSARAMTPGTPASDAPQRERPAAGPTPLPQLTLNENERRVVLAALPELSQREREVFFAICEGGRNQDIAKRLHIASPTLRTHLTRLNHKLDTTSKADLIRLAAAVLLGRYRAAHAAERLAQDPHSTPRQRGDL